MWELGPNLGFRVPGVTGRGKDKEELRVRHAEGREFVGGSIDGGCPCTARSSTCLSTVIYGYDEKGYYFRGPGCDKGKGPKLWRELGDSEIGGFAVMASCAVSQHLMKNSEECSLVMDFVMDYFTIWASSVGSRGALACRAIVF